MADPGFLGQHSTTTAQTSSTTFVTSLRFDYTYMLTIPGIFKVVQLALNSIGFICIQVSVLSYISRGSWFSFVAMTAFWITGILLMFYLFHIIEKFGTIPWLKIEFIYCVIWTGLYLIAACLAYTLGLEAYTVAGICGFCATVMYALDACFKFIAIKSGQLAQGEMVISNQITTIRSPVY